VDESFSADSGDTPDSYSQKPRQFRSQTAAAKVAYAALTDFITKDVWPFNATTVKNGNPIETSYRNQAVFVLLDPNGVHVPLSFGVSKDAKALLALIGGGENYKIACKIVPETAATKANPPGHKDSVWAQKFSTNNLHLSAARDNLVLSSLAARDGLSSGASASVQPGTKSATNPSPPATYSIIGAAGYTVAQGQCGYRETDCIAFSYTPLFDVYYGPDKNLPKTTTLPAGSANMIDRIGAGVVFASRWDPSLGQKEKEIGEQALAFAMQFIPEFITDSHFGGKEAYAEARLDAVNIPYVPCFGNDDQTFLVFKVACGLAIIGDYDHSFRAGQQSLRLYSNFFRLGGEVGTNITPTFLNDAFSLSLWYRAVDDLSNSGATAHNFTGSAAFKLSGDGDGNNVSLSFQYTDGVEDITLFPLPTWSVSIRAGL